MMLIEKIRFIRVFVVVVPMFAPVFSNKYDNTNKK